MKILKSKKEIIEIGILIVVLFLILGVVVMKSNESNIEFQTVKEEKIPRKMIMEVIPTYREYERALACLIDDKIYVYVTRGKKMSEGYNLEIEKLTLEVKDGKSNLIVKANYIEPEDGKIVKQVENYPMKVLETTLKNLPNTKELRAEFMV